ncbi:MAG: TrkA family potassium uptake protein [Chloroflexi bacterium]|nr:MAG: TrkA family potassium uptake protein [Chloroflexota bacterium]
MAKDAPNLPKQLWGNIKGLTRPQRRESLAEYRENSSHSREFVVVGLGRFGTSLAMTLHEYGHDVLAIDSDMKKVQRVAQTLPHVVQMDASNIDALREVGAETFDTGVVCIGSDFESNLLVTVVLRKLGVRRVISKATTTTQQEVLLRIGADEVILPEHEAAIRLGRRLSAIDFVDFMELGADTGVVEIITPDAFADKSLHEADIRNRFGLAVIAIKRAADDTLLVSPGATEVMRPGDTLVMLGKIKDFDKLRQLVSSQDS